MKKIWRSLFDKSRIISLEEIQDRCIAYSNNIMALVVEIVKNGHLFIEIEESNEHVDKIYEDVEEMKKDLIGLKWPLCQGLNKKESLSKGS